MNVPAVKRVQQILMNMGRMRWMITEPQGKLMIVNIPEFILHVKEGKNKVFDMNVVVGKEGHNTTMFTGNLNQIVFSPYWNVPASIVEKEIVPGISRNPKHNLRALATQVSGEHEIDGSWLEHCDETVVDRPGRKIRLESIAHGQIA